MRLPQELIDRILLFSDVRVAIAFKNEFIKRVLLPVVRLPLRLRKCEDPAFHAWVKKYNVQWDTSGGLLQLIAVGQQDVYFTGSPQITSFLESLEQTFTQETNTVGLRVESLMKPSHS